MNGVVTQHTIANIILLVSSRHCCFISEIKGMEMIYLAQQIAWSSANLYENNGNRNLLYRRRPAWSLNRRTIIFTSELFVHPSSYKILNSSCKQTTQMVENTLLITKGPLENLQVIAPGNCNGELQPVQRNNTFGPTKWSKAGTPEK
jgi:hypothetical protein